MLRWIIMLCSAAGLGIGIWAVSTAVEPPVVLPLARPATVNPFELGVAALGIVEPDGREVGIVAPESGLVTDVLVQVGDHVTKGQALFQLDTRVLDADLVRAEAAVRTAQSEIERWRALPRAEDLPPLEATLARAQSVRADREDFLNRTKEAMSLHSGNSRDIPAAEFALQAAQADVAKATADLAKAKAGGWVPDRVVAEALVAQREAEVAALRLLRDRLTVRAPRDGTILQRAIEPGEHAGPASAQPSLVLGDLSKLCVRAHIDEEDIGLVTPGARAFVRTRGAVVRTIPLALRRIEPYARPKQDLAGTNTERVDTRVIDAVFEMTGAAGTVVVPGQAVDVYIEVPARPAGEGGASGTGPSPTSPSPH